MPWFLKYIGRPWSATGEGPDAFTCWQFCRFALRADFGIGVPVIPHEINARRLVEVFRAHPERQRWLDIDPRQAVDGDLVLLGRGHLVTHIGLYTAIDGGRIVHCHRPAGVVCQDVLGLRSCGWQPVGYLRHGSSDD